MVSRDFIRQLEGYGLTTANILYRLPDHPKILQTYIWQEYDVAPRFPVLLEFLEFWKRELAGPLHSVQGVPLAPDPAGGNPQGRRRNHAPLTGLRGGATRRSAHRRRLRGRYRRAGGRRTWPAASTRVDRPRRRASSNLPGLLVICSTNFPNSRGSRFAAGRAPDRP